MEFDGNLALLCNAITEKITQERFQRKNEFGHLSADGSLKQYRVSVTLFDFRWEAIKQYFTTPDDDTYFLSSVAMQYIKKAEGDSVLLYECLSKQVVSFDFQIVSPATIKLTRLPYPTINLIEVSPRTIPVVSKTIEHFNPTGETTVINTPASSIRISTAIIDATMVTDVVIEAAQGSKVTGSTHTAIHTELPPLSTTPEKPVMLPNVTVSKGNRNPKDRPNSRS